MQKKFIILTLSKILRKKVFFLEISIGICAYNERENIGRLLEALEKQELKKPFKVKEILVVCSGCTDGTEKIVESFAGKNKKVRLFVQEKKEGKASAINLVLKKAKGDLIVLESADTLPLDNTIYEMAKPFLNPKIGMSGGHPVPTNEKNSFTGYFAHLIWKMHHEICMNSENVKTGEITCHRNVVKEIPKEAVADEAWIQSALHEKGFKTVYASNAIVFNHSPETLNELVQQRKRFSISHYDVRKKKNFHVQTGKSFQLLGHFLKNIELKPKEFLYSTAALFLEAYCRTSALIEYKVFRKDLHNWKKLESTKKV